MLPIYNNLIVNYIFYPPVDGFSLSLKFMTFGGPLRVLQKEEERNIHATEACW